MLRNIILVFAAALTLNAQSYTRGVGIYPGDPKQDFGATPAPGGQNYRNLALHRAAYQSSAYDYNLTAQLITDGIKETWLPRWVTVATSDQGVLRKQEREHALDHNLTTPVILNGAKAWIEVDLAGGETAFEVDG